ncbi:hypothetical protein [Actinomadura gamaensis]|uniref:XRE family transcriptional regulator n=1 Tax=Actinomadura gamaensis TaxID=1763541 RepID=A0ABV9U1J2_9ACTN
MQNRLTDALREGPFHEALRTAIAERGLSLHRVRHHLARQGVDVGVTTLSYWQRGRRRPERPESLRAVRALEEVLDLPDRSLTALLEAPRPRGRAAGLPPGSVAYREVLPQGPVLEAVLADFGGPLTGRGLETVHLYERLEVGPDRDGRRRELLQTVRARPGEERVDRCVTVYRGDPGCDVDAVQVRALDGCRVGRVRRHPAALLVVAELMFDSVLLPDETYLLRYEVADDSRRQCDSYERGFRFPTGQYVLQVAFDAAALPVRCHRFARRSVGAPELDVAEVVPNAHRSVHLVAEDLRPGVHGIRWEWD